MVQCLWSGELGSGLMDRLLVFCRAGVGVLWGRVSGSGDEGQDKSSRGGGREEAGRESEPWPGPGV